MKKDHENGQGDSALQYQEQLKNAAPELYSALCGLLMHFEGPNCLAMQADVPAGFYLAEVEKARDAIAKAMGRQSPAQILQADYAQAEDSFPNFWENE
jgi:hypothetical protein